MTSDVAVASPAVPGELEDVNGTQQEGMRFAEEIDYRIDDATKGKMIGFISDEHDGKVSLETVKRIVDKIREPQYVIDMQQQTDERNRKCGTDMKIIDDLLLEIQKGDQQQLDVKPTYTIREQVERKIYPLIGQKEKAQTINDTARMRTNEKIAAEKAELLSKRSLKEKEKLKRLDEIIEKEENEIVNLFTSIAGVRTKTIAYHDTIDQLIKEKDEIYSKVRQLCDEGKYREAGKEKEGIKRRENDIRILARTVQEYDKYLKREGIRVARSAASLTRQKIKRDMQADVFYGYDSEAKDAMKDKEIGPYINIEEMRENIQDLRKLSEKGSHRWESEVAQMEILQKYPSVRILGIDRPQLDRMTKAIANTAEKMHLRTYERHTDGLSVADDVQNIIPYV